MSTDKEYYNELFAAIHANDVSKVETIISRGADVNDPDPRYLLGSGNTPLHDAANLGNIEVVKILLTAGANIDAQCDCGWTPLMRACNSDNTELAKFLIHSDAKVNIKNSEGYTALMRTRANNNELIHALQSVGAE